MENTPAPRTRPTGALPSPRLLRSRSGAPTSSTTKSSKENINPSKRNSFSTEIPKVQRSTSQRNYDGPGRVKRSPSVPKPPSAWALSPGRAYFPIFSPSESSGPQTQRLNLKMSFGGNGGGVLKYFRQKKVPPDQQDGFQRFRILHNRLFQWRFANARAEASMAVGKSEAEKKFFGIWIRICKLRNSTVEKQTQIQKLKLEKKLFQIIKWEMCWLEEWAKLEKKNVEAIGRITRKLSAMTIGLPLVDGAKLFEQARETQVTLRELIETAKEVSGGTREDNCHGCFTTGTRLQLHPPLDSQAKEKSLRVHLIQVSQRAPDGTNLSVPRARTRILDQYHWHYSNSLP
ncbi:QWRF family [Dillenia turbinata]|uniref:QWRF family n=1 Tax=Dillenia turbinata TaxID=194707 RepID=A0AAN8V0R3_9MAGN